MKAFVQSFIDRLEEQRHLWNATPSMPDLQSAWQLLLQPALPPRLAHHASIALRAICHWA